MATSFQVRKRRPRTREGTASVITAELLQEIRDGVLGLQAEDDILILDQYKRATPGSAAGFGYQVKEKLEKRFGLQVKSSPQPADPDAWDALSAAEKTGPGIQAIKNGQDEAKKAAIAHYPAFYPADFEDTEEVPEESETE